MHSARWCLSPPRRYPRKQQKISRNVQCDDFADLWVSSRLPREWSDCAERGVDGFTSFDGASSCGYKTNCARHVLSVWSRSFRVQPYVYSFDVRGVVGADLWDGVNMFGCKDVFEVYEQSMCLRFWDSYFRINVVSDCENVCKFGYNLLDCFET